MVCKHVQTIGGTKTTSLKCPPQNGMISNMQSVHSKVFQDRYVSINMIFCWNVCWGKYWQSQQSVVPIRRPVAYQGPFLRQVPSHHVENTSIPPSLYNVDFNTSSQPVEPRTIELSHVRYGQVTSCDVISPHVRSRQVNQFKPCQTKPGPRWNQMEANCVTGQKKVVWASRTRPTSANSAIRPSRSSSSFTRKNEIIHHS